MHHRRERGSETGRSSAGAPPTGLDRRLLESVVENAYDAVVITDASPPPGPHVLYVNEAYTRMTGYGAVEVIGRNPGLLQGPGTDPAEVARVGDALRRMEPVRAELLNYRKDGTPFWVDIAIIPVQDEAGRTTHFASIQRDITNRREAELALQHLQRQQQLILEAAGEGIYGLDTAGRTTFVNPTAAKLLGWQPEDLIGQMQHDVIHHTREDGTINPRAECPIYAVLTDGRPRRVKSDVFWRRDGTSILVEYISQPIVEDGRITGAVVTFQDVTEGVAQERALRESEERERFLSEASRKLGGSLDLEAILRCLTELMVPARADVCLVDLVAEDGTARRAAAASRDPGLPPAPDGASGSEPGEERSRVVDRVIGTGMAERVGDLGIVVPLVARGRVLGAMTLAVDGDQGRRYGPHDVALAEELAGRAAGAIDNSGLYGQVQCAVRTRDEVLRVVAHDLRSPIGTVALSAGLLEELVPRDREDEHRQLRIIQRSVDRADHLIRDLLDQVQLEVGQLSFDRKPESAASLAREALELHAAQAASAGIRLEGGIPGNLPWIDADHERILQVFSNLVGNAIKFTPDGGHVVLRAEDLGDKVLFSVQDDGPGIPEDQMPHLFETFWQARRGGREGAGLGLSIARGIVHEHGGRIWAESQVDVGSTFHFTLPVRRSGAREGRSAAD